jgi:DHA1 family quinolone resistance protein-like MFS transporter
MGSVKQIQRTFYLVTSLFWLATALPMALLVLIIQTRGVDLFQIGILLGVYSLTIVLLEVPTGGLADAVGRKRVALLAYGLIALASAGILFAFSFPVFLLGFILNGAGRALASGALDAWFVDALQAADPDVALQPALAKAGTFTLLALGAGTLLGGVIPRLFSGLPAEGTAVLTPFSITIIVSLVVYVTLLAIIALRVHEVHPSKTTGWQQGFYQVPAIIHDALTLSRQNRTILLLLGATLASGLALISMEALWQPHFAALLGGSEGQSLFFGVVLAGNFLIGAIGNMVSTPLSQRLHKRYGLVAAVFQGLRGLFLILLAIQADIVTAVAFFWLVYLGMGVMASPHSTLVNEEIPSERRSSMLSIQSLVGYIGSIIGSVGLGYIARQSSTSVAWIVAGVILMVSLFLYIRVDIRQAHQSKIDDQQANVLKTG